MEGTFFEDSLSPPGRSVGPESGPRPSVARHPRSGLEHGLRDVEGHPVGVHVPVPTGQVWVCGSV